MTVDVVSRLREGHGDMRDFTNKQIEHYTEGASCV